MKENEMLHVTPKAVIFLALGGFGSDETETKTNLDEAQKVMDKLSEFMITHSAAMIIVDGKVDFIKTGGLNKN